MIIKVRQGKAESGKPQCKGFYGLLCSLLCGLLLSLPPGLMAQAQAQVSGQTPESAPGPAVEPVEVKVSFPDGRQVAMMLATPGLRNQALLDLAAAVSVLNQAGNESEVDHAALAQKFLQNRTWLQMLVDRVGWMRSRSAVLDPAAWLVLGELQQHDLGDLALVFPGRVPENVLIYQVFQRSGQRLAAANLPALLLEIEPSAIVLWNEFIRLTGSPDLPDVAWKEVETTWFTDRNIPALKDLSPGSYPLVENIPSAMSKQVSSLINAGPPDGQALKRLRYSILNKIEELKEAENTGLRDQLEQSLYLVNLIDGLNEGRYFEFVQGLLSVTSRLLEGAVVLADALSLDDWLLKELPAISAQYAADFAMVDPRLNTAMAAAHDVLLNIAISDDSVPASDDAAANDTGVLIAEMAEAWVKSSRAILADAVAQLALMIPDMAYYFDMPVRARISEEVDICISIAAGRDDSGSPTMTRSQFDACMETLLKLAEQETRLAELSGNVNGPFTADTLRRELNVIPWQRINYGIGYLHRRHSSACQPPANALPNPLEWAVLATTMSWFAEHSPEFFYTPENEARLTQMRSIGEQLIFGLAELSSCLASLGTGVNDLVNRSMTDYELALRELASGIRNAEADFRAKRLRPGADVSLEKGALQKTAYRPEDLVIEACDKRAVCEMSGRLSTTRALIGLFPDEYLVAEQTGMGHIEICYRNMEWVQRRSELVRADDENVANYFGRLGFDLMGRYVENDRVSDIFGFRFTSPEEHHYLFAQASEEVLNDSCPVEWVGTRVVTPLRERRGGMVPDRLTYLAASRKLPSRLLQSNWDQGAEWRDWFVTGIGVSSLDISPAPEILTRLNQHLQNLYRAEQAEVYQRVLLPNARNAEGDDVSLFTEMSQVSIGKALIRMQMMLFYPESLLNSDSVRMAILGDAGLLDGRVLRRFREDDVALTSVNKIAHERLVKLREAWLEQPEAVRKQGSIPPSLMHALTRINIIYRQFFTSRAEPLREIEVLVKPQEQTPGSDG